MKKLEKSSNIYYDIEGNAVYNADTREFCIDISKDVQSLLLECIDSRISIKAVSNTRLDYETILMLIQDGVMAGVKDIDVWKIANSGFTPDVMRWALKAVKKNIRFVDVEYGTRVNPKVFLFASRAAEYNIDMTKRITPLTTIDSFRRSLKWKLFLEGKMYLFKKIDISFSSREDIAVNTLKAQM